VESEDGNEQVIVEREAEYGDGDDAHRAHQCGVFICGLRDLESENVVQRTSLIKFVLIPLRYGVAAPTEGGLPLCGGRSILLEVLVAGLIICPKHTSLFSRKDRVLGYLQQ